MRKYKFTLLESNEIQEKYLNDIDKCIWLRGIDEQIGAIWSISVDHAMGPLVSNTFMHDDFMKLEKARQISKREEKLKRITDDRSSINIL